MKDARRGADHPVLILWDCINPVVCKSIWAQKPAESAFPGMLGGANQDKGMLIIQMVIHGTGHGTDHHLFKVMVELLLIDGLNMVCQLGNIIPVAFVPGREGFKILQYGIKGGYKIGIEQGLEGRLGNPVSIAEQLDQQIVILHFIKATFSFFAALDHMLDFVILKIIPLMFKLPRPFPK